MSKNINASLFSTCSDCRRNVQEAKTWCPSCYKKRCAKWDKEIEDYKRLVTKGETDR